MKSQVLERLDRYSKPVKTKHLATRMEMDRTDLALELNRLEKKKKVVFVDGYDKQNNYVCGWVSAKQINTNITISFLINKEVSIIQSRGK